jgi:hypothetical protein
MFQDVRHGELQEKTQQLLQGPLKHVRAATLAAALLPLASVAASPAEAQDCGSGGICGFVWNDINQNGIQDAGEPGVEDAVVIVDGVATSTDASGLLLLCRAGGHTIACRYPRNAAFAPDAGGDDTLDSDGVADGFGYSVASLNFDGVQGSTTDFGFFASVSQPGTGTPGYWKNHPEAWPVENIAVGGVTYTKTDAISWLDRPGKDKTITMFSSLVPAMLNVLIGNDSSCVASTIAAADDGWLCGPVGSGVRAQFRVEGRRALHRQMDNCNNGMLCAPHRDWQAGARQYPLIRVTGHAHRGGDSCASLASGFRLSMAAVNDAPAFRSPNSDAVSCGRGRTPPQNRRRPLPVTWK